MVKNAMKNSIVDHKNMQIKNAGCHITEGPHEAKYLDT